VGATPGVPDNAGSWIGWNPTSQGQRRDRPYGNLQHIWSGLRATSLTRALLPGDDLSLLTNHFSHARSRCLEYEIEVGQTALVGVANVEQQVAAE